MTTPSMTLIRQLPLHSKHAEKGARFGAFGDWEVPLYYTSIIDEHKAVRSQAGLFDISHMGEFFFEGTGAINFLDLLLSRSVPLMRIGQALYMPLLNDRGLFVDDVILYRLAEARFLLIVNAGNVDKDREFIKTQVAKFKDVSFQDRTEEFGLLALQGPNSQAILEKLIGKSFAQLPYYSCVAHSDYLIARTGYTGEDGFEIMVEKSKLNLLWDHLFEAGKSFGLLPAGFGARDTLRLEAGMLLYGHDMDERINPLEAGIGWTLDWNKNDFVGKSALLSIKEAGVSKKLVGFEMVERGIPRQGCEIWKEGALVGEVTSGSFSPTLQTNLGMGYVQTAFAQVGQEVEVVIREKKLKAKIVKLPFYKRNRTA